MIRRAQGRFQDKQKFIQKKTIPIADQFNKNGINVVLQPQLTRSSSQRSLFKSNIRSATVKGVGLDKSAYAISC